MHDIPFTKLAGLANLPKPLACQNYRRAAGLSRLQRRMKMSDDRAKFLEERQARLGETLNDLPVLRSAKDFFEATVGIKYSYNFDWLGVPIIQYPQDLIALQEIIWKTKPDLIIETGVARGGSMIFYASMLQLLANAGHVIGIDIDIRPHNRDSIRSHPLGGSVTLIEASSIAEDTIQQVKEHIAKAKHVMVVLDSYHTHEHVLKELELYSSFVTAGNYLIVFDTCVEVLPSSCFPNRPWSQGNNPMTAVDAFLRANSRFEIDLSIDAKLLVSAAPRGYLKCVRD
jgi:cephalosporin hydroxylase